MKFKGYRRADGRIGIRNQFLLAPIIPCQPGGDEIFNRYRGGDLHAPPWLHL